MFYYAEFVLDGKMLFAYKGLSRKQLANAVINYAKDILFRNSQHTIIFGREKDLNFLGGLGNLIMNRALPYV